MYPRYRKKYIATENREQTKIMRYLINADKMNDIPSKEKNL